MIVTIRKEGALSGKITDPVYSYKLNSPNSVILKSELINLHKKVMAISTLTITKYSDPEAIDAFVHMLSNCSQFLNIEIEDDTPVKLVRNLITNISPVKLLKAIQLGLTVGEL